MSARSPCTQFTPQLWRASKCKYCFNDKGAHSQGKENTPNGNIATSAPVTSPASPSTAKRISSSFISADENLREQRRSTIGSKPTVPKPSPKPIPDNSNVLAEAGYKPRPAKLKTVEAKKAPVSTPADNYKRSISTPAEMMKRASLSSPVENIQQRLEMNKQLLAKDDQIHALEIRNQNLENEIRTLKDQNAELSHSQQNEEEHKALLDKISTLRRKLGDLEAKYAKAKEECEILEEKLKDEGQCVSKLKMKINNMEHEQYLLEMKVEREQKHKMSIEQEKDDTEHELEQMRKNYRSMQRESRKLSNIGLEALNEARNTDLEEQLRQTQRRLGAVEVENEKLKEKINRVEQERQGDQVTSLEKELGDLTDSYRESIDAMEDLKHSHLAEIQSLQTELTRLQDVNDSLVSTQSSQQREVHSLNRQLEEQRTINEDTADNDEELLTLRSEVSRLQDKCSAFCDIELIHINLNRELDRQRERADKAESVCRLLEREVEQVVRDRDQLQGDIEGLRKKEEECRKNHRVDHNTLALPSGILKKNREPAERDEPVKSNQQNQLFARAPPPHNRRKPSRDHLQDRGLVRGSSQL